MILVVDDNLEICRGIELLLRNNGFDAKCFTSAQAALEFIQSHPPKLVILDDMMPDKTGLDILATIRSSPEFPEVPILMMSAGSDENREKKRYGWVHSPGCRRPATGHASWRKSLSLFIDLESLHRCPLICYNHVTSNGLHPNQAEPPKGCDAPSP